MIKLFRRENRAYLFFSVCMLFVISLFFIRFIAMTNTTSVCGKVVGDCKVKGHLSFEVLYFVDNKPRKSRVSSQAFKIKSLQELKKIDCIKIEYSNYLNSYIGIIDTVIGSGEEW